MSWVGARWKKRRTGMNASRAVAAAAAQGEAAVGRRGRGGHKGGGMTDAVFEDLQEPACLFATALRGEGPRA